ncbi:MAG: SH3 domain-containing protein [Chryseolinea sp.]
MQRWILKIVLGLILISPAFGQVSAFRLTKADSLYEKKQYTQSLEHYKEILASNEYSPAMLLKMAYIEEAQNRPGQSLYYLNLYYIATKDKSVLEKMDELATKFNLDGYNTSDADLVLSFYHDFHDQISITLGAIAIFCMSLILFWKRKGKRSIAMGTFLLILLVLMVVHINLGDEIATGIIGEPNTYLMDGPSAGASVVSVIAEGHKLEIVGKVDVWYQVKWNNSTVFVKERNLLPVVL